MFDLQIPQSLADLPGRVIGTGKHAIARRPKRTYAERLAQMRARTATIPREDKQRRDRESYRRHSDDIKAGKRARRKVASPDFPISTGCNQRIGGGD